ncbi:MAG: response regulator transcription factor [Burkholderiales bacterium]|nr:response regulator transcription factor [Burkholderiales bacterium]
MTTIVEQTVFIVDDDVAVRDALALLLGLKGYRTAIFSSAEDFLAAYRKDWRGCLVLDIKMSGMSGLDLQSRLAAQNVEMPIVIITGHGDAASARQALKSGAVDFLEKPLDEEQLVAAVGSALERDAKRRAERVVGDETSSRMARLTPRERQVMDLAAAGRHNREIGEALGISPRTVEVYKARLMEKLQARNLSELIRFALTADRERAA